MRGQGTSGKAVELLADVCSTAHVECLGNPSKGNGGALVDELCKENLPWITSGAGH